MPFILSSLILFCISHQTDLKNPLDEFQWGDKLLHTAAYLLYGISIIIALAGNMSKPSKKKIIILTLCIGTLYSIFDEIHQSLIPGRFSSIYDVFADIAGIVLSLFFIKIIFNIMKKLPVSKYCASAKTNTWESNFH